MRQYSTEDLVHAALKGFIVPSSVIADRDEAKAEWVNRSGHLPMAHFTWRQVHQIWDLTEEQAEQLRAKGFEVQKSSSSPSGKLHTYGIDTRFSHLWFCNFRRYGWSWTTDEKGEQGYCYGVTYANSELPIHFLAETPQQVVRDSLIATWKQAFDMKALPGFFNTYEVSALMKDLYEDALQHVSEHARGWKERRRCMGPEDAKGFYVPVVRDPAWEAKFPMPATAGW